MTCVTTAGDPFLATGLEENELRFGGEKNEDRTYKLSELVPLAQVPQLRR
jgi:hypothetical protein